MTIVRVHGLEFIRTGSCTLCGGCDHECSQCPHSKPVDGTWLCGIQGSKAEVCQLCTSDKTSPFYDQGKPVTHEVCEGFPQHPWLTVVREGKCGYKFSRVDGKPMDTIPFLSGKAFLRPD